MGMWKLIIEEWQSERGLFESRRDAHNLLTALARSHPEITIRLVRA